MANVWDAMKKHQVEEAAKAQAEQPRPSGNQGAESAPPPASPVAAQMPAGRRAMRSAPRHGASTNGDQYSELILAHNAPGSSISEEYRALRISLTAHCEDGKFCYVITSSDPGEGKTVTCANLAVMLAEQEDRRTIVVDGDLRKGRLGALFGKDRAPGLADILKGEVSAEQAIQSTIYPNLSILPSGGAGTHEVGELLVRPELEDLVMQLRRTYDHVIFDSPPINGPPDAGMIGHATGRAIVVVRMNKTHRESVKQAICLLHAAKVEVNGIILTHRAFVIPSFLYGGPRRYYHY